MVNGLTKIKGGGTVIDCYQIVTAKLWIEYKYQKL